MARPWRPWRPSGNSAARQASRGDGGPSGKHLSCWFCGVTDCKYSRDSYFLPRGATVTNGVLRCVCCQAKHLVLCRYPIDGHDLRAATGRERSCCCSNNADKTAPCQSRLAGWVHQLAGDRAPVLCQSSNGGWTLATSRAQPARTGKQAGIPTFFRQALGSELCIETGALRAEGRCARSLTVAARRPPQLIAQIAGNPRVLDKSIATQCWAATLDVESWKLEVERSSFRTSSRSATVTNGG